MYARYISSNDGEFESRGFDIDIFLLVIREFRERTRNSLHNMTQFAFSLRMYEKLDTLHRHSLGIKAPSQALLM